jgi:hypothetical protein
MNSAALAREFLRVARLAKEVTGFIAVREFSSHDSAGMWHLRDAENESICEVAPDGTVVELCFEAPPPGLLDRIRDLRAFGFAGRAIYGWFGMPVYVDHLTEARLVFDIAMQQISAPSRLIPAPTSCKPVVVE